MLPHKLIAALVNTFLRYGGACDLLECPVVRLEQDHMRNRKKKSNTLQRAYKRLGLITEVPLLLTLQLVPLVNTCPSRYGGTCDLLGYSALATVANSQVQTRTHEEQDEEV